MKALELAGYIVGHCLDEKLPISNLQLQKILYFVQLESIRKAEPSEGLIEDARFEAWRFGPVISSVYYAYCLNGGTPIEAVVDDVEPAKGAPAYVMNVVHKALAAKPWDLVTLTHRKDGAWEKAALRGYKFPMAQADVINEAFCTASLI